MYLIKELRNLTGLSQISFAKRYGIPVSTLRKWEQGESSPAPYVITLLAQTIPGTDKELRKIRGADGGYYYYNKLKKYVTDSKGNNINIQENLDDVNDHNLGIYIQELFEAFYEIQEKFNRDCRFDKTENIIWS